MNPKDRIVTRGVRARLDTKTGREALRPRREPYWSKVAAGRFLGFRRLEIGGTWVARYRSDDGSQHYRALGELTPCFGYDEARAAADAWFRDLDRGVTGFLDDGTPATVATACSRYLDDRRRTRGPANARDAERRFARTIDGTALAALPLARVRARHIKEWRDALVEGGLSRASANRTLVPLKAALHLAVRDGLASADLTGECAKVPPFEGASRRRDLYLDRQQRRALLAACTGPLRDLVEAATLTGSRAGELTGATRGDYDRRTRTLHVNGKTGPRSVPLNPRAVTLFDRLAKGKLPGAPLLTKDGVNRWQHSDWDKLIRAAAAEAGLPAGVCLYTLRHSWITSALLGGMSTLEVAKIAGTGLPMIQRFYGHLVDDVARERLAAVDFL